MQKHFSLRNFVLGMTGGIVRKQMTWEQYTITLITVGQQHNNKLTLSRAQLYSPKNSKIATQNHHPCNTLNLSSLYGMQEMFEYAT
jgi:hypothetical protein